MLMGTRNRILKICSIAVASVDEESDAGKWMPELKQFWPLEYLKISFSTHPWIDDLKKFQILAQKPMDFLIQI